MSYAAITGWGKCMPPAILDNEGLATFLDTSDEWITSRTGIKQRRISHVPMTHLSHIAAARALACAGLDARDVGREQRRAGRADVRRDAERRGK